MLARNYLFMPFLLVAHSLYSAGPGGAGAAMRKPTPHQTQKEEDNGNRLKFRSAEQVEQERRERSPIKYRKKRYKPKKDSHKAHLFGMTYKQEPRAPKKTLSTMNFDELKVEKDRLLKNQHLEYDKLKMTSDGVLYSTEQPFYTSKRTAKEKKSRSSISNTLCGMEFTLEREPMPGLVKKNQPVDYQVAIKYMDRMRKLADDPAQIAELTIELGDAYFELERYAKASTYYDDFITLYPGHPKLEYVLYKDTLANYLTMNTLDRDQSASNKTIELTDKFMENKTFTAHLNLIKGIRTQCFEKLVDHELYVCNFYLNSGYGYKGVEQRLKTVENLLKEVPHKKEEMMVCQERLVKVHQPTMHATPELAQNETKEASEQAAA